MLLCLWKNAAPSHSCVDQNNCTGIAYVQILPTRFCATDFSARMQGSNSPSRSSDTSDPLPNVGISSRSAESTLPPFRTNLFQSPLPSSCSRL